MLSKSVSPSWILKGTQCWCMAEEYKEERGLGENISPNTMITRVYAKTCRFPVLYNELTPLASVFEFEFTDGIPKG